MTPSISPSYMHSARVLALGLFVLLTATSSMSAQENADSVEDPHDALYFSSGSIFPVASPRWSYQFSPSREVFIGAVPASFVSEELSNATLSYECNSGMLGKSISFRVTYFPSGSDKVGQGFPMDFLRSGSGRPAAYNLLGDGFIETGHIDFKESDLWPNPREYTRLVEDLWRDLHSDLDGEYLEIALFHRRVSDREMRMAFPMTAIAETLVAARDYCPAP